MDYFEAIAGRRSIRKYKEESVNDKDLRKILEAGRMSASWANTQCWEIIVVADFQVKAALAKTLSDTNPARKAMVQAPIILAACGQTEKSGYKKGAATTVLGDWLMFDVALFLSNVTHAAHALGYGTVHVGLFDHVKVGRLLEIPDDVQVVELLPLGRPELRTFKDEPPRKDLDDFVHYEKF